MWIPLVKAKKRIEESLSPLSEAVLFHVKLLLRHLFVCANIWRCCIQLRIGSRFT